MIAATRTAWYVYGVVSADDAGAAHRAAEHATAVGGDAGVELVESGRLAAIVSRVPADEFDEAVLPSMLNEREWLEANARAHEDVLQAVGGSAVVPFRFGTIYHELDDVRKLLDDRRSALSTALARVQGRVEIGVKVWVDRARVEASLGADAPDDASSGRAYLEQRSRARHTAEAVAERCADVLRNAHARLLAAALEGVVNRPQPRELTGRDEDMLLNAAFLVPAGDTAIEAEVDRLNAELGSQGFTFEATGPWPPHNFVDETAGRG